MKKYRQAKTPHYVLDSIVCDACKVEYDDPMDMQEFLSYKDSAGYGANFFRDMDSLELDLCEKCKFELLGKYIRVKEYDQEGWETISSADE